MNVGIVTNLNGRGLEKDARLLTPIIESLGHEVELIQFDAPCEKTFSLLIFLEITPRNLIGLSGSPPWLIINPEFLKTENVKLVKRSFGKVLCKTHEAHRICSELFGEKAQYVGFISEDRLDVGVPRQMKFLHVAGQSSAKGTTAVIDAWRWKRHGKPLNAKLTVVADWLGADGLPDGVTVVSKITDEELRHLQNECQFHLQPSQTEGWSHVIHEALSVNATILTVGAEPMSEVKMAYKIPSVGSSTLNLAKMHDVSALDIYNAVLDMLKLGRNGFSATGAPRQEFLEGNAAFVERFTSMFIQDQKPVAQAIRTKGQGLQIAFIGNFKAEHSTENQIKWALEEGLGHEVEMLQENEVNLAAIRSAMEFSDLLCWVRTPGWLRVPDREMLELLASAKIPTASIHLDKFFGIPEREVLIGVHPFWKTECVFTADGSRAEDFKARGVNHFWMPPAASAVYSHPGTPLDMYRCDVGFVGARDGYHIEHPFRAQLIDFLEKTYGDRFKLIDGLRGHGLNDFYQSCKVCVADCFGGGKIPRYWSDRMVETPMRHGFLLSPKIEGMTIPLATFDPENLMDLREQIEYWLTHADERKTLRSLCADHVAKHDTWTVRMKWVIKTVGKQQMKANHA